MCTLVLETSELLRPLVPHLGDLAARKVGAGDQQLAGGFVLRRQLKYQQTPGLEVLDSSES